MIPYPVQDALNVAVFFLFFILFGWVITTFKLKTNKSQMNDLKKRVTMVKDIEKKCNAVCDCEFLYD